MRRRTMLFAAAVGVGASAALAHAADSVFYRLNDQSTWQQGCFDPCACPLGEKAPIAGTFRLTPIPSIPEIQAFAVTDVRWVVSRGDQQMRLTGKGEYRIHFMGPSAQQLELDLQTDGGESQHFDSGLVAGGAAFPAIDVTVSINGIFCFDTVIHVAAEPARRAVAYRLARGSTWQQGCFGACDCLTRDPDPMRGTFLLRRAESNPLFDIYAVTDVNWLVLAADGHRRLTGSGTYEIGGEVAITQRLQLDLRTNGGAVEHFDSGMVAGGWEFPAINIEINIGGKVCFDTVIQVMAKPVADFDLNGCVDGTDFDRFHACVSGPSVMQPDLACSTADLDDDGDVDQEDAGLFQRCITGPDGWADPACAG